MAATGINKKNIAIALIGVCGPYSSVMKSSWTLKKKRKEVIKQIECCDVLVECD